MERILLILMVLTVYQDSTGGAVTNKRILAEENCDDVVPNGFLGCTAKPGESCAFGCNTGYRVNNVINQITCLISGNWDTPVIQLCIEVNCHDEVPNGLIGQLCTAKSGESCSFECNTGYRVNHVNKQITCLPSGYWDTPVTELCIEVKCNDAVPNGFLEPNCTAKPGESCAFECNAGYSVNHVNKQIACLTSGYWDTPVMELCIEVKCTDAVPNGFLESECTATPGELCLFECNTGYNLNNVIKQITCLTSGYWDTPVMDLCIEVKCNDDVPNGFLQSECTAKPGELCSMECNTGYRVNHVNTQITCLTSGYWDTPVMELCIEVKCNDDVPNGFLGSECTAKPAGESCAFECNTGYRVNHVNKQITCLTSGYWDTPVMELCIEVKCNDDVPNGFLEPNCTAKPEESCAFECNTGYNVNNVIKQIGCLTSGYWDTPVIQLCIEVKCNDAVPNGFMESCCTAKPEEFCSFECNTGYRVNDVNKQITCLISGYWDTPVMELCIEVKCSSIVPFGYLASDCTGLKGSSCEFGCDVGYTASSTKVSCQSSGMWNPEVSKFCVVDNTVTPEKTSEETSEVGTVVGGSVGGLGALVTIFLIVKYGFPKIIKNCSENRKTKPNQVEQSPELSSPGNINFYNSNIRIVNGTTNNRTLCINRNNETQLSIEGNPAVKLQESHLGQF